MNSHFNKFNHIKCLQIPRIVKSVQIFKLIRNCQKLEKINFQLIKIKLIEKNKEQKFAEKHFKSYKIKK